MTIATKAVFEKVVATKLDKVVTFATYDRVIPKTGEWEGNYRVTLRKSDNLAASTIVLVADMDAAHALLTKKRAVYVKNFRVAAALQAERVFAHSPAVEAEASEDAPEEGASEVA